MGFLDSITGKLLIANVIVFFLTVFSEGLFNFLALTPTQAISQGMIWQFFTFMYVHGGFEHIFLNMWGLLMFGPIIEKEMGAKRFFIYYTLCGIGSGLFHVLIEGIGSIPLVGASGAIFGVMTAFGLMFPKRIIYYQLFIPMPAIVFIGLMALLQFVYGIAMSGSAVAFFGHLGGMIVGLILIKFFDFGRRKRKIVYFWEDF